MNTAFFFFPSTSDRILWPQLRKALKHILISILSIYLKVSACLSAALSGNTFWVCSLVLSLFWCFVLQNCVNAVLLTPPRPDTFWPPPMNWVLPASHSPDLFCKWMHSSPEVFPFLHNQGPKLDAVWQQPEFRSVRVWILCSEIYFFDYFFLKIFISRCQLKCLPSVWSLSNRLLSSSLFSWYKREKVTTSLGFCIINLR